MYHLTEMVGQLADSQEELADIVATVATGDGLNDDGDDGDDYGGVGSTARMFR